VQLAHWREGPGRASLGRRAGRGNSRSDVDLDEGHRLELGVPGGDAWWPRVLDEVIPSKHVQERDEGHDHGDAPSEPRDKAPVASTEQQVDPDQHYGDRMQDAEDDLEQFLQHGAGSRRRGGAGSLLRPSRQPRTEVVPDGAPLESASR